MCCICHRHSEEAILNTFSVVMCGLELGLGSLSRLALVAPTHPTGTGGATAYLPVASRASPDDDTGERAGFRLAGSVICPVHM